jgi:hypothetical protein
MTADPVVVVNLDPAARTRLLGTVACVTCGGFGGSYLPLKSQLMVACGDCNGTGRVPAPDAYATVGDWPAEVEGPVEAGVLGEQCRHGKGYEHLNEWEPWFMDPDCACDYWIANSRHERRQVVPPGDWRTVEALHIVHWSNTVPIETKPRYVLVTPEATYLMDWSAVFAGTARHATTTPLDLSTVPGITPGRWLLRALGVPPERDETLAEVRCSECEGEGRIGRTIPGVPREVCTASSPCPQCWPEGVFWRPDTAGTVPLSVAPDTAAVVDEVDRG